ncbi:MAG: fumarylacetoacetate hydrolase family protein, partial [Lentisphaerae bacterium]|nr:fumarylacetoacetate hydrolase family protein [Lentisphaerota bacterium]
PDSFCPLGPWLVTPDEVPEIDRLRLTCRLNGEVMQDAAVSDMIFKIPFLIAYISASITLRPGDVISTGTPAGVGSARRPPRTLRHGDTVEIAVDGLGCQISPVLGPEDPLSPGATSR